MSAEPGFAVEYLGHALPGRWPAGSPCAVQVRLANRGNRAWQRAPADGRRVELLVRCGEQVLALAALPRAELRPGEEAVVHAVVRVPGSAGPHELVFDLVEHGVTVFSARGAEPLRATVLAEAEPPDESERLFEPARRHSPWSYQPTGGLHRGRSGARYPLVVAEARGCRLRDPDGREYVDYVMGWGSALLGYAHPEVQEAVRQALGSAAVVPFPVPDEGEVARQVSALVPSVERLTFGKNGSDACTLAARLARVFTGRRTLLFSGYHGWQDFWAEQSGFAQSGVPERVPPLIHRFRMNDVDDFERLFERHRADLAAVMLEPAGAVEGPQGPVPDADAAFLRHLRQRTREAGALLVFDEIFTCFRYAGHTVQQATGVAPDLTCLGKALGGGLPLSALGGRADVLESAMDRTHYGPTFGGEAYALAAARAARAVYQREPVAAHVWSHGERLRALLDAAGREAGLAARCVGPPFRMVVAFDEPDAQRQRLLGTLLHQELLRRGVLTYKGFWLPSWAHDDGTLEQAAAAARAAFAALARALRAGRLDEALETPLLAL